MALLTLHLLLELVALDVLLHEAWPIPVLIFPLATPIGTDAVLAFDLTLELAAL